MSRYHGIFAPNSALRERVVSKPKGVQGQGASGLTEKTEVHRHQSMTWAQRLKRVFADSGAPGAATDAFDLSYASRGPPVGELPFEAH